MSVWCQRNASETIATILGLFALLGVLSYCSGCAWLQQHGPALVDLLADKTACALANMSLPTEVVIQRCAVPADLIPKVIPLLGQAREEAAKEAAGARADERAKIGAAVCGDAGAP